MPKPKILVYYLPQFHAIPENDEWWGEGFTEWTNVKKENKVSVNLHPLNNNYYSLLDEKTVLWQTQLAEQYGVYGFVYYHYYFCGRKILEKPAENLLKNKHINQKFCFNWANHDWNRSWEGNKTLLLKQEYGNKDDWEQHFNYLLPFFKDERYIKVDNKPLFILYRNNFTEKETIYKYFNECARKNGFNGIFFAESISRIKYIEDISDTTNAIIIREPNFSNDPLSSKAPQKKIIFERLFRKCKYILRSYLLKIYEFKFLIKKYNGNRLAKNIVKNARYICDKMRNSRVKCFLAAFSNWNNTSRHGIRGYIITPISNKNYIWYLTELKKIAEYEGIEFIFFNAWNEWAEGMILEPDTLNGYRFLEGIKKVFS